MAAPRGNTPTAYLRHPEDEKVAVFKIDAKAGVWECDRRYCDKPGGSGPLYGPPAAWVGAWWKHLREQHNTDEQEMA